MYLKAQIKMSVLPFRIIVLFILWTIVEKKKKHRKSVSTWRHFFYFSSSATVNLPGAVSILWPLPLSVRHRAGSDAALVQCSPSHLHTQEVIPFPYSNIQKREAHCLCCNFDNLTGRTVIQILSS